jgi:hypothetical protein
MNKQLDKSEALDRLIEIMDELRELGLEAGRLVQTISDSDYQHGCAYDIFSFGSSSNRHNQTLEKTIEGLENKVYGDESRDAAEEQYERAMTGCDSSDQAERSARLAGDGGAMENGWT